MCGEEDRVKLSDIEVHLRQPQRRAAPGIELQFHRAAIAAVVAIAHKGAGDGDAVEQYRATQLCGEAMGQLLDRERRDVIRKLQEEFRELRIE